MTPFQRSSLQMFKFGIESVVKILNYSTPLGGGYKGLLAKTLDEALDLADKYFEHEFPKDIKTYEAVMTKEKNMEITYGTRFRSY